MVRAEVGFADWLTVNWLCADVIGARDFTDMDIIKVSLPGCLKPVEGV